MKERIEENEKRLDDVLSSVRKLEEALSLFKSNKDNLKKLNKYYGSKNWFKDKEAFESKKITNIKAGVLSEDAVWNINEDIDDLIKEMKNIIKNYK